MNKGVLLTGYLSEVRFFLFLLQSARNDKERRLWGNYTREEILRIAEEEDVEFIRLQFTDMFGVIKKHRSDGAGTAKGPCRTVHTVDGSLIAGKGDGCVSDLYLRPDPDTFTILPWRPAAEPRGEDDLRPLLSRRKTLRGKPALYPGKDKRQPLKKRDTPAILTRSVNFSFSTRTTTGSLPRLPMNRRAIWM